MTLQIIVVFFVTHVCSNGTVLNGLLQLKRGEAQRGKCNERSLPYHVICENRMLR